MIIDLYLDLKNFSRFVFSAQNALGNIGSHFISTKKSLNLQNSLIGHYKPSVRISTQIFTPLMMFMFLLYTSDGSHSIACFTYFTFTLPKGLFAMWWINSSLLVQEIVVDETQNVPKTYTQLTRTRPSTDTNCRIMLRVLNQHPYNI